MSILAAEAHNPLIPPLGEIIVGLIAFAIVFFVFAKYVAPRFEQVFQARRAAIEGGIERAETMQAEAKAALDRYNAQLAEARSEAAAIREQARTEGQQILEEMRVQAQEEQARIGTLAVDLAGRVVGESLSDEARRRGTVDRFLDELDGMTAGTPDGRTGSTVAGGSR